MKRFVKVLRDGSRVRKGREMWVIREPEVDRSIGSPEVPSCRRERFRLRMTKVTQDGGRDFRVTS